MARLKGKVAIISGGSGGIGEATARVFLREGARVMLVGRSGDKLGESTARLQSEGEVKHFVAEATDEVATRDAVDATTTAFGGVDILFANAGTEGVAKPLQDLTYEEFSHVLQVNVVGVWLAVKHCVAPMVERGGGSIIATSSIGGLIGFPTLAPYVSSKHAVWGFVKTAALELAASGIRVNAIAPGPIANRMIKSIEMQMSPDDPEAIHDTVEGMIAMKRYGTNDEVANLALFLGSDESSYTTGAIYTADGGFTAA
ncbi:MAG: oxidoreductase [Acidobacteria bacterium]|nr:oxidoreductase [Acidobacteriota bacterium]|tara:strand:+ start:1471 stop:2241 length:771 start_codon:yes stop_codon:yes gene_type:complete